MNLINLTTKMKSLMLLFAFTAIMSCKTGRLNDSSGLETGTIKVAILYPNAENSTFDMDYYKTKHMPMVAGFLGENLKFYEINKGIAGRTPNEKVPFLAVGYFYVSDIAEYNKAIAQNRDAIIGDFKNYTNVRPILLISEIEQVKHNQIRK